jgi:hypothetical protein
MSYPWRGDARPLSARAFIEAANDLGCDVAAIRAVWEVEAAGQGFLSDRSVVRRFEPHHMPGSSLTWRDSLRMSGRERNDAFMIAHTRSPMAALRATSWGGPQIMGFNAEAAGYRDAREMVAHMAAHEDQHLAAFVGLVQSWRLATALRAHDWLTFARRWNGSGQPEVYARRMEAAYRRHAGGKASPVVLRIGARGAAVKRLQEALGVRPDGAFGRETEAALIAFQKANGLIPDGVAGAKTWAALEAKRDAKPIKQTVNPIAALFEALFNVLKGVTP